VKPSVFNIRVYGLLINKIGEVLVADEFRLGMPMTKFPGGGLEFGEGPVDCLKRECEEELGQDISIIRHFYTTEHYQPTELLPSTQQLISIYYLVETINPYQFSTTTKLFDFPGNEGDLSFRWVSLKDIEPSEFTFPIDRYVAKMLRAIP
jgi:8-oxo-dGTP diphosphatase